MDQLSGTVFNCSLTDLKLGLKFIRKIKEYQNSKTVYYLSCSDLFATNNFKAFHRKYEALRSNSSNVGILLDPEWLKGLIRQHKAFSGIKATMTLAYNLETKVLTAYDCGMNAYVYENPVAQVDRSEYERLIDSAFAPSKSSIESPKLPALNPKAYREQLANMIFPEYFRAVDYTLIASLKNIEQICLARAENNSSVKLTLNGVSARYVFMGNTVRGRTRIKKGEEDETPNE